MSRPLRVLLRPSDQIDEDWLRELWRLRLEMLTLTRPEEQDWQEFRAAVVGPDRFVFVFLDPHGTPQGFFSIAMMPVDVGRRRMLLMFSKYFYFRRAYRGHPKTIHAPWLLLPIAVRRFGPRTLHFVTTAYPQSYVSLTRTSGRGAASRREVRGAQPRVARRCDPADPVHRRPAAGVDQRRPVGTPRGPPLTGPSRTLPLPPPTEPGPPGPSSWGGHVATPALR